MMTFVNMDSDELVILPTHRVVHGLNGFFATAFFKAAEAYFTVEALPPFDASAFIEDLKRETGTAFVAVTVSGAFLSRAKPDAMAAALADVPDRQRQLDLTQLHSVVFEKLLGLDAEKVREQTNLRYLRDAQEAVELVRSGEADIAFLTNPVTMEQLKEVAFAGEVMPQKSTDFFPSCSAAWLSMRWIKTKLPELSSSSASNSFALHAASFALPAAFMAPRFAGRKSATNQNFRRLFRAAATFVAMSASIATFAQSPPPTSRFVVVLDAAHGGDGAGAILGNEAEKNYTLAFSVRLRSLLMARGFTVVMTRESDDAVEPDHRAEIANHADAQACLSLHAAEGGSGVHLFVSSLAPVQDAHFLAWKTAQASHILRSLALAGVVNSALSHATVPVTLGRTALPGIDSMTCPAVAIEIAPDRSTDRSPDASDSAGLDDPDYQARVADALAAALVEWRSQPPEGGQR